MPINLSEQDIRLAVVEGNNSTSWGESQALHTLLESILVPYANQDLTPETVQGLLAPRADEIVELLNSSIPLSINTITTIVVDAMTGISKFNQRPLTTTRLLPGESEPLPKRTQPIHSPLLSDFNPDDQQSNS